VTTSARKEQLTRLWEGAWDHGDKDGLDTLLAPDYRRRTRSSENGQTREEVKAMITTTRGAFPDLTTTIDDIVEEGDRLAIRWHADHSPPTRWCSSPSAHRHLPQTRKAAARTASCPSSLRRAIHDRDRL
jgi:predicted ester cyclase